MLLATINLKYLKLQSYCLANPEAVSTPRSLIKEERSHFPAKEPRLLGEMIDSGSGEEVERAVLPYLAL